MPVALPTDRHRWYNNVQRTGADRSQEQPLHGIKHREAGDRVSSRLRCILDGCAFLRLSIERVSRPSVVYRPEASGPLA